MEKIRYGNSHLHLRLLTKQGIMIETLPSKYDAWVVPRFSILNFSFFVFVVVFVYLFVFVFYNVPPPFSSLCLCLCICLFKLRKYTLRFVVQAESPARLAMLRGARLLSLSLYLSLYLSLSLSLSFCLSEVMLSPYLSTYLYCNKLQVNLNTLRLLVESFLLCLSLYLSLCHCHLG